MAAAAETVFPSAVVSSLAKVGFDEDSWGVGVSGVVENPSPFARINRLRNWYLDECPYTVDAERAVLVTEAYRNFENEPQLIKVAETLAHVLAKRHPAHRRRIHRVAVGAKGAHACRGAGPAARVSFGLNDSPNWVGATAAGETYRLSARVRSENGRGTAKIKVREYHDRVKVAEEKSPAVTLSAEWQRLTVDYVAQRSGSTLDLLVSDSPADTSESFEVDDVSVCLVPDSPPATAAHEAGVATPEVADTLSAWWRRIPSGTRRRCDSRPASRDRWWHPGGRDRQPHRRAQPRSAASSSRRSGWASTTSSAPPTDFAGHEQLRLWLVHRVPKYGNDDERADSIMRRAFEAFFSAVDGRPCARGGAYRIQMLPTTCHVYFGSVTGALPDGRRAGLPLSEGISPVQGADRHGPTAVVQSAAKMDHVRTGGTLLNLKFAPSLLEGEAGIDHLAHLVRGYFKMDGHHVQFNVVRAFFRC